MPRLMGVDVPGKKHARYALRYIHGIGPKRAEEREHPRGAGGQSAAPEGDQQICRGKRDSQQAEKVGVCEMFCHKYKYNH